MTKEEQLKQEAEENSFRYTLDKPWACEVERKQIMAHFEKGYLASAESREKKIEELEKENTELKEQNERMKCCNICAYGGNDFGVCYSDKPCKDKKRWKLAKWVK